MSESYSVVRNWLLPQLLEVLSKNKHNEYPQKIFEHGTVSINKITEAIDYERIASVVTHPTTDFTEAKQNFDALMHNLGITNYEFKETEHDSFIPGRVARVYIKDKTIAYVGELSPKVLTNWEIITPTSGFELNLTELFNITQK